MKKRTLIVSGLSKTYAMTDWRVGYLLAESLTLPETGQAAAEMPEEFALRRRLILEGLSQMEGLSYAVPDGAFYVMADVSASGLSGEDFARCLPDEKKVAVVPAIASGNHCGNYICISYAASRKDIADGLVLIKELCRKLRNTKTGGIICPNHAITFGTLSLPLAGSGTVPGRSQVPL